ncbi:hypothetical protein [Spiroplasma platyhelix]|uniref:Uncharacterized protein n=1 Tax=Spiroplasma platyhelix PALS-1 TaxID=1276218 RepID=A0A846TSV1_9MOLU|nr:hypothetical protein [Spiroplasma platyhelix]MBE4704212.1 hypothetical protein [Spiroplasma platyhelix PALS-1]NKE38585.1 hypothetical protein [Spiroplasma platyhelix PALS-1]UJB28796.1 hypothetical protein SPLAT_v1c00290 [Spiroplasma platyhelix PALS-1]
MKCGECTNTASVSITENKDLDANNELAVYYYCIDCYVSYKEKSAN